MSEVQLPGMPIPEATAPMDAWLGNAGTRPRDFDASRLVCWRGVWVTSLGRENAIEIFLLI